MKKIVRLTEDDLTRIVKRVILEQTTGLNTDKGFNSNSFKDKSNDKGFNSNLLINKTNDKGFNSNKKNELGYNPGTPLTDVMMLLMKKVYLRYKPLGRNGIDTNKKKDDEVLQIQKYFNSTGTLGKGQKYDLLKENGIFDGDTFWQVNNTLGSKYKEWWLKNKY
jgi:hypothetical protein